MIDIIECDCSYFKYGGCKITISPPRGYKCACHYMGFWTCLGIVEKCNSENDMGCCGCKEEDCCSDKTAPGGGMFAMLGVGVGDCDGYDPLVYKFGCNSLEETCKWRDEYNNTCNKYPGIN